MKLIYIFLATLKKIPLICRESKLKTMKALKYFQKKNHYYQAASPITLEGPNFNGVDVLDIDDWPHIRGTSLTADNLGAAGFIEITQAEFLAAYEVVKTRLNGLVLTAVETANQPKP